MTTPDPDAFALLARLTEVLLRWSYEGTAGAERIVAGVAARYGLSADVTFLADAAILTVGERTVARSGSPTVPPLDQVSAFKRLLGAIDRGEVSAGEALASAVFGDAVGTFIGAVAMTVAALLLGRGPNRPPPYALYLGAFYVLTPGSHGLRGIESWIGGRPVQGVAGVAEMLGMLTAIGVGMLIGAAAVRRPLSAGT